MTSPVDFWDLILAHRGKKIAVMGGAPSLADHLATGVQADVWISANHHGILLREADYLLCMDERIATQGNVMFPEFVRERSKAKIISPYHWADYQLVTWPQNPALGLSGMVAAWAAFMMGAKSVSLLGMDGYGGSISGIEKARLFARDIHCPVRVVGGGELTKVWPEYDPAEKFGRYAQHSAINAWLNIDERVTVEAIKTCEVRGTVLPKGERISVMRFEVKRLLKHRLLKEV